MRIFLAPMEGVVDHHLRKIYSQVGGIDLCVTEFVRVTQHVLPRKVFIRYCPELLDQQLSKTCDGSLTGPSQHSGLATRIQFLGSEAQLIAENARKAADLGAPGIDLNFGCPAKTVNKNRGGACLLDETHTIAEIVEKTRLAVPADIPVTAKIRLGFGSRDSYLDNAHAIYNAGATELIVHARSKQDGYKPPAYWEYIAEIRQAIPIPVVANGEIWSLADYIRCKEVSQCQDVMLGRGLLAKPDLAEEIKAYERGEHYQPMPWSAVARLLQAFFTDTCKAYPKKYTGNRAKQWLFYLQRQYPQAKALFEQIKKQRDYQPIYDALEHSAQV